MTMIEALRWYREKVAAIVSNTNNDQMRAREAALEALKQDAGMRAKTAMTTNTDPLKAAIEARIEHHEAKLADENDFNKGCSGQILFTRATMNKLITHGIDILKGDITCHPEAAEISTKLHDVAQTVDRMARRTEEMESALESLRSEGAAGSYASEPEINVGGDYGIPIGRDVAISLYQHALERIQAEMRDPSVQVDRIHKALKSV